MASKIEVDEIMNAGGDNDSGIDLATNDVVKVKTANTERMQVNANTISMKAKASSYEGLELITPSSDGSGEFHIGVHDDGGTSGRNIVFKRGGSDGMDTESMRIDSSGILLIGTTDTNPGNNTSGSGLVLNGSDGKFSSAVNGSEVMVLNRMSSDGDVLLIRQAGSTEGIISVSGSTVSYGGFTGLHESSGIITNTPVGTVVSTIDELDVYPDTQDGEDHPKKDKTRADHAKVKVSDSVGDKRVYGVVNNFNTQGKVNVASVGVGSIKVTGSCVGGDLLESNGDGTAKVQSDDIVRSKTIGKVTIGNSSTDVKLVSCVLYCG